VFGYWEYFVINIQEKAVSIQYTLIR
jgi:GTPase